MPAVTINNPRKRTTGKGRTEKGRETTVGGMDKEKNGEREENKRAERYKMEITRSSNDENGDGSTAIK